MKLAINILNYTCGYWCLLFYGSLVIAFFKMGILPKYGDPDPWYLIPHFTVIFELFHINNILILAGVIVNPIFILFNFKNDKKILLKSNYFFICVFLLKVIVVFIDPMGFFKWFVD
jgi:hypothetical protein